MSPSYTETPKTYTFLLIASLGQGFNMFPPPPSLCFGHIGLLASEFLSMPSLLFWVLIPRMTLALKFAIFRVYLKITILVETVLTTLLKIAHKYFKV